MITLPLGRHRLGAVAFIAVLAGCQAPQSQVGYSTGLAVGGGGAVPLTLRLIYVSDPGTNEVQVYKYLPPHALYGTLTGFSNPQGLCADSAGHVFVTNMGAGTVQEFAHGGTTPINTFNPGGAPMGCAVQPVTDDLAVGDSATGKYTLYHDEEPTMGAVNGPGAITSMYYLGYDNSGYLYMDGMVGAAFGYQYRHNNGVFHAVAVVPVIANPGGVQWSGVAHRVWIGDQNTGNIYDVKINGAQQGLTVTLAGAACVVQFIIRAGNIVGPDRCSNTADVYTFPVGAVVPPAISVAAAGAAISPP
jgi:hypothetical protein